MNGNDYKFTLHFSIHKFGKEIVWRENKYDFFSVQTIFSQFVTGKMQAKVIVVAIHIGS